MQKGEILNEQSESKGFAPILIVLLIGAALAAVGGAYYFGFDHGWEKSTNSQTSTTPQPTSSRTDETANWKTYTGETAYTSDGSSKFELKYPPEWQIEGNLLYPIGKNPDKGLETVIVLGAGGHGGPEPQGEKIYPAGKADYYLNISNEKMYGFTIFNIENYSYIFEFRNLPIQYEDALEKMIQTVKIY